MLKLCMCPQVMVVLTHTLFGLNVLKCVVEIYPHVHFGVLLMKFVPMLFENDLTNQFKLFIGMI